MAVSQSRDLSMCCVVWPQGLYRCEDVKAPEVEDDPGLSGWVQGGVLIRERRRQEGQSESRCRAGEKEKKRRREGERRRWGVGREREEWERDLKMLSSDFKVGGRGQEPRVSSKSWKNPGNRFSPEPSKGAWLGWHPNFSTLGFILTPDQGIKVRFFKPLN